MEKKPNAEQLFKQGNITIPLKGGDVFVVCREVSGNFPFRISGEQEQNGQMVEIIGSTGLTQADALQALPYRFRKSIDDVLSQK